MPRPEPTEIRIDEHGNETHESWLLIRASHISGKARLFDSEITHQHYIEVTVSRCTRKRDLSRDWLFNTQTLIEIDMSQAQWGAFVSSFGNGSGVPATLAWFDGEMIPGVATHDSRLDKSHKDVRNAASKAMAGVEEAHKALQDAFERNAGKKEMRQLLTNLQNRMQNLPGNMEFAAKSLTEHTEAVVTRARADVEAMVLHAIQNNTMIEGSIFPEIESGHAQS